MSFSSEFKEFAIKGNVMDLAIGIIIGVAFGKIVDSLVNDIIMPIAGLIIGPQGFVNSYLPLSEEVRAARLADPTLSLEAAREKGNVLAWGNFLTVCIDFLIIAIIVFMLVKAVNNLRKDQPAAAAN